MLRDTKAVIANIKKLDIDLTESEDLIQLAEKAFKSDDTYQEGQVHLTEAKILARQQEDKYHEKNASTAISQAQSMIITLKQKGIDIDSAEKFLDQSKTALEIREFKKAILFASKAKMTAKKIQATAPPPITSPEVTPPDPEQSEPDQDQAQGVEDDGEITDPEAVATEPKTDQAEAEAEATTNESGSEE